MKHLFLKTGIVSLLIFALAIPVTIINKAYGQKKDVTVAVEDGAGRPVENETVYILDAAKPCICAGGRCTLNVVKQGNTKKNGRVTFSGLNPETNYIAAIGAQCLPNNCGADADCAFNCTARSNFKTNKTGGAPQVQLTKN